MYCFGVPLAAWWLTTSSRDAQHRQRVQLLTSSYRDSLMSFEAVDLLRKLLQCSIVLIVAPDSKFQLWFGTVVSLAALLVYFKLEPYRHKVYFKLLTTDY